MKIESRNYNIAIFINFKIEKKKFNTNVLLFASFFHSNHEKIKIDFIFKFVKADLHPANMSRATVLFIYLFIHIL